MKLVVGLGNPEEKYKNNRHNVGFMLIDCFASALSGTDFTKDDRLESLILKSGDFILAKPLTFMNNSGKAVLKLVNFYKVNSESLFVVYDDLDIALGEYKIIFGKPPKTHNGVYSVIENLRTTKFWHIRIGVENRDKKNRVSGERYVLEDFSEGEKMVIKQVLKSISFDIKNKSYAKKK